MGAMASQITSLTIVYSTVYWGAYQSIHQSSASLAFVRRIHRWPVNSPHKWPVTRKMVPFDDIIMVMAHYPRYWPFVKGIHRSPAHSPDKVPVMRRFDVSWMLASISSKQTVEWSVSWDAMDFMWRYGNALDLWSHTISCTSMSHIGIPMILTTLRKPQYFVEFIHIRQNDWPLHSLYY